MKKIGQKLSFLTKIMLVVGLLISNLSSLSVVFAYEAAADLTIDLVGENLEINYNKTLAEEVESVSVKVYESYTYLDGYSYEEEIKVYDLTPEEVLAAKEGELELTYDSMFDSQDSEIKEHEKFDGTYKVKVELVDTTVYPEEPVVETEEPVISEEEVLETTPEEVVPQEETTLEVEIEVVEEIATETVIAFNNYEKEITHESGLNIKLFDANGNEIVKEEGIYQLSKDKSSVKIVAQILSGGFAPTDKFIYDGEEFFADELLEYEFSSNEMNDFTGFLFGEYVLPVEVKVEKIGEEENEELVYNEEVNINYESYEMNAFALNSVVDTMEYEEVYSFYSTSKDGILYVFPSIGEAVETDETSVTRTMLDIYNILETSIDNGEEEDIISYTLLRNGINVLEAYDASLGVSLEEYLSTLLVDETVQIILSNEGLTISFSVVIVGDLNNDNIITSDDVLELINQVIGEKEATGLEKTDIFADEEVNSLDVLALNQIVKSKLWELSVREEEFDLDARLDVKFNDKELNEENYLVSGNEFTVDYVLSLSDLDVNGIAGQFEYDKELFELVSVEVANEWLGNNKDGKFLYLGDESLTGPEEVTLPEEETPEVEGELEVVEEAVLEKETLDHVVLTATFRALSATDEESNNIIKIKDIELYNSDEEVVNYILDKTEVSTEEITVSASDDNTLQYLEVAGVEIILEPGVYEYEITVDSDVTLVDLKYILSNVAANVTSVVAPDELVEGENKIVVTVTSESGVSQDYTITVIREKVEEETTTQVNYGSYTENYEKQEEEIIVTEPAEEDEEVEEEKESNLSRIVIIILILLVIAGLVYLIFKDDDNETKKANKDVNRLKKESIEPEVVKNTSKNTEKNVSKTNNKKPNNGGKNNNSKNKKKER